MIRMANLAGRVFNTPVAVHPGKAAAILAGIGGRIVAGGVELEGTEPLRHVAFERGRPSMARLGNPLAEQWDVERSFTRVGPVAVIGIEGTLVHKGKWLGTDSGETSYEGLWSQVDAVRADPSILGVVLEVDSCGGEVAGVFDLAEAMFQLSAEKPTIAILTDVAYSAGYLLAATARQIVMPNSGGCGSIGVIALHLDYEAALEEAGIKVTILAAGKHKADGNPYQALPASVASRIRGQLEALRRDFAAAVSRYRAGRLSFDDAMATEAEAFDASDDPVSLGLVDAIGRPSEAFDLFVSEMSRPRR